MSIKYEANWTVDTLAGFGHNVVNNKKERSMCHIFKMKNRASPDPIKVELVPGITVQKEWLFGPVSDLKSKQVMYPCSRYRCKIPCPCMICQHLSPSSKCSISASCSCTHCYVQFKDHNNYHRTWHKGCKFCNQLIKTLPNFNYWFLNDAKRLILNYFNTREHFWVQPLVKHRYPAEVLQKPSSVMYYGDYESYKDSDYKKSLLISGYKTCDECNYSVKTMKQFKEHIELNHLVSKRFFHCFNNTRKTDQPVLECDQCYVIYKTKKELARHVLKEHYQKVYNCDFCSKEFTREDNLLRHKKSVHDPICKKICCPDCGKNFSRQDEFVRHKSIHEASNSNEFTCETCNTVFTIKKNLERHRKASFDNGSAKYHCSDCEKDFCTSKQLREHANKKHIGLICEDCGESFTRKNAFEVHKRNRHFVSCRYCSANLCNRRSLSNHKDKVHMDQILSEHPADELKM